MLIALIIFGFVSTGRAGEEVAVHGRITYQVPEGIYVNVGSDTGLQQGTKGSLVFDNGRILAFEVLHVARNSALLRLECL